jgi:hypothetical protein
MNRSTPAFPADLLQPAVFDNYGHGGISVTYCQHFLSEFHVVLRVELLKRYALLGVEFASLCAMGTAWLRVYLNFHRDSPMFLVSRIKLPTPVV